MKILVNRAFVSFFEEGDFSLASRTMNFPYFDPNYSLNNDENLTEFVFKNCVNSITNRHCRIKEMDIDLQKQKILSELLKRGGKCNIFPFSKREIDYVIRFFEKIQKIKDENLEKRNELLLDI